MLRSLALAPDPGHLLARLSGDCGQRWRKQIPVLSEQGYWVWAPIQRGYNKSDKPRGLAHYGIDALADDVIGLIDAAGRKQAILVAHDWGAAVVWRVAQQFPTAWRSSWCSMGLTLASCVGCSLWTRAKSSSVGTCSSFNCQERSVHSLLGVRRGWFAGCAGALALAPSTTSKSLSIDDLRKSPARCERCSTGTVPRFA